nr:hypothetical protein CFP56_18000 [Quercus suber]
MLSKRSVSGICFVEAGNSRRILLWFSNFAAGGGLEHRKGAKALSQFAFVNRDICWEELEWKGKHGQSPAMVATKPHYFLDLDVQLTVENFLENVPEFWSSNEFAESVKNGEILFIDREFFLQYFVDLLYKEDSTDVWEVINKFLIEESFSSLCHRLLIILEERDLNHFLVLLGKLLNPKLEPKNFSNSSYLFEVILSKCSDCGSIDQMLLLNAVINQGRQLLRLLRDEEGQEEHAKIKDIVSQICAIPSNANSLVPIFMKCFKTKTIKAIKWLGLQSWVLYYRLSEDCQTPESWESLFKDNDIGFRTSNKYELLHHDDLSEKSGSDLDHKASVRVKHRKKGKRKRRKKNFSHDDTYDIELPDFDTTNRVLGLQANAGSWLLCIDGRLVIIPEGKVMRGWRGFRFELQILITPKRPVKISDGMHKQPHSNVRVSQSFAAVIRGEKQKNVVVSDSRPLAIDKGKSIVKDPWLVVQNPVRAVCGEKEMNQKNLPEG